MLGRRKPAACSCGVPNRANHYVALIIGRNLPGGTQTESVDAYFCDDHLPAELEDALNPDIAKEWYVIESTSTRIR